MTSTRHLTSLLVTSAGTVVVTSAGWWSLIGFKAQGHRASDGHTEGSISGWQPWLFAAVLLGCALWAGSRGHVFVPALLASAVVAVSFQVWSESSPDYDSDTIPLFGLVLIAAATLVGFLCVAALVDLVRVQRRKVGVIPAG